MWVSTDEEVPFFQFTPVIDCGDPSFGGSVFGVNLIWLETFNLQNEVDTVDKSDDEIGFIEARYAVMFIGNAELEVIVAYIALYNF